MTEDLKEIRSSDKMYIKGDKTSNFYKISVQDYLSTMRNNVTVDYKTVQKSKILDTNKRIKTIAVGLG